MDVRPTSHCITLPNRPVVQENGEIVQGDLQLHYWEWQGRQPTILISHGASLHGRCYDRLVNGALSGFHVIALDFRGHGRSQKHPLPYRFHWFGEDVLQFVEQLNLSASDLLGIGHSLGGYALTLAAALAPRLLFRALLLLDPPIYAPYIYDMGDQKSENLPITPRRKDSWLSVEQMIAESKQRERLARWPENVLRDYCTYALDEQMKLQCTPEREFYLYRTSIRADSNIYPFIRNSTFLADIPVDIVRSSVSIKTGSLEASPTAVDLVKLFKKGRDRQLKDARHLFPLEQPDLTIDLVKEFIAANVPTSHFVTLPNRPIRAENGEIQHGPLQLHYWQWQGHQPTVLICHGGSFHSRCYDRIIREALAGFHVIALDFRGHGRSQKHPPPYSFRWFGEDVLQFIEQLNLPTSDLLGIGHSLGGHALIYASALAPRRLFRALLLLDPGLYAPAIYRPVDQLTYTGETVLRRKRQWSSIDEMVAYMEKRRALSRWPKETIRDYCTYALDDNFQLACTPEIELSLYLASTESHSNIYQSIRESQFLKDISVHIIRAPVDQTSDRFSIPTTAVDLVSYFPRGHDTELAGASHLFPIEQPELTIRLVKAFLQAHRHLPSHL